MPVLYIQVSHFETDDTDGHELVRQAFSHAITLEKLGKVWIRLTKHPSTFERDIESPLSCTEPCE